MRKDKILIVDDVAENVEILKQYFKAKGFDVLMAYGGKEAISKAEMESPDLILLDVMMPDLDGFRVCEVLKKERTAFKNVPIILVTAKSDVKDKVKGLSLGADDYVTKPYEIQELLARVKAMLRLKSALDELKEINTLKNQFLGMASHDIKSPISRIDRVMKTLLAKKENLNKEQVEMLQGVKKQAEGIFQLVSDLLNVSKIESGHMALENKEISVSNLLGELVKMNKMSAQYKKINLKLDVDKNAPNIVADPNRLLEVFDNLLTNALKFTPEGKSITLKLINAKGGVEVVVADEGVGIPETELSKVFDRFSKLTPQATKGEKGTGLGLAICKEIIGLHKGKISVESKLKKGTLFKVFLPRKAA